MLATIFRLRRMSDRVALVTLAATSALALSALPVLLQSCASASRTLQPPVDVSGTWKGSTSAGCFLTGHRCDAYRLISLTFVQNGADLTGSYTCSYGTMNCLGLNDTGTIAYGRISDLKLRPGCWCSQPYDVRHGVRYRMLGSLGLWGIPTATPIVFFWSHPSDSNRRPADYESIPSSHSPQFASIKSN
jgi:hypothetical protein